MTEPPRHINNEQRNRNDAHVTGNISRLVRGDYDKQWASYITQVYIQQGLTPPRELIQLHLSMTLPLTTICKEIFFPQFLHLIQSFSPKNTMFLIPHHNWQDKVKVHLTEAIHSWLATAPLREHSPHNNELLRLPEDTMPVQRIEIKRQVRLGRIDEEREVMNLT